MLANLCHDAGLIKRAAAAYQKAVMDARFFGDQLLLADILRKSGFFKLNALKDFGGAFKDISEAVQVINSLMYEDEDNPHSSQEISRVAANTFAALGNYFFDTGNTAGAENNFITALEYAEDVQYKERIATLYGDLGNTAIRSRHWSKALERLEKANAIALRTYAHAVPSSFVRLSVLYAMPDAPYFDPQRAWDYALNSLHAARKAKWPQHTADALRQLSELKKAQGDLAASDDYLKQANKIYKRLGMK